MKLRRALVLAFLVGEGGCVRALEILEGGGDGGSDQAPPGSRWSGLGGSAFCDGSTYCDWTTKPRPAGRSVSDSSAPSQHASLGLDREGNPVVAWSEEVSGASQIYVKRFDGAAWVELAGSASGGGISGTSNRSTGPSIILDHDGRPVVAWRERIPDNHEIYLKRLGGSGWVALAGSASGGGVSGEPGMSHGPGLATDGNGNPMVAWFDGFNVFVKRYEGGAWDALGVDTAAKRGVDDKPGHSMYPSLALDPKGRPVVAWQDDATKVYQIYVKRFDGSVWVELGAGSASGGGVSDTTGSSHDPHLIFDADGAPVVAWEDDTAGNNEIYVRRFDGSRWVELGTGSASGGGVSASPGYSSESHLALGGDGGLLLAWQDHTSGNWEIYARAFDGSAWVELGAGSASGGGVSNSRNRSEYPYLAALGSRACVAYQEPDGAGTLQILLRCINLSAR